MISMAKPMWRRLGYAMALAVGAVLLWPTTAELARMSAELPAMDGVPTAEASEVGMSAERLERLERSMQAYVERGDVAGVVSLVARRGKVVHFSAHGERDEGEMLGPDAMFRIASMTKPIASVALMMLYEEGHFQLMDPIAKWLPEFAEMEVASPLSYAGLGRGRYTTAAAAGPITVQHLLTHTAGLPNTYRGITKPDFDEIARRGEGDTLADFSERVATLPLNFDPGAEWEYGRATDLVGLLVEKISGQRFDRFLQSRIFEPLGMVDTHFYVPEEKLNRFSALYRPDESGGVAITDRPTPDSRSAQEPTYFSGAGGLVSTARDYFRFHQMMLNGGELDGARILGRKTIELMTLNHIGDNEVWLVGPGYGFGLGYAVVQDPGAAAMPYSVGSYFWWGAFNTTFWVDPEEELIGILMTQLRPYTHLNIRQDLATLAYQAIVD